MIGEILHKGKSNTANGKVDTCTRIFVVVSSIMKKNLLSNMSVNSHANTIFQTYTNEMHGGT